MQTVNAENDINIYSAKDVLSFIRIAQVAPSPDSQSIVFSFQPVHGLTHVSTDPNIIFDSISEVEKRLKQALTPP